MTKNNPLELYIHIPFCIRKCHYCDFLSGPASPEIQENYREALKKEIKGRSAEYTGYRVVSVFFGGGTPSLVPAEWITDLLDTVRQCCRLDKNAEITIEVNPGTVKHSMDKLEQYYRSGINRLSIGLQSALDAELICLGRVHTYAQFEETYRLARKIGFANINVDMMSALPGQDMEDYRRTVETVLGLAPPPEHISAYSLIVEEGTPFAEAAAEGRLELPDEDTERKMYWETDRLLWQKGYHRYEISNYARTGYECRHNIGYWLRTDYAGFGIGAASLIKSARFSNTDDMDAYIRNPLPSERKMQLLTRTEQMEEFFFLGLRLTEGISYGRFRDGFGCDAEEIYGDVIEQSVKEGLLNRVKENNDIRLKLTDRGLDVSNYCMARFMLE